MCLFSHPTLPVLLSHCKPSEGGSQVSGTCPVFATCVYDQDTAASQFLHGDSHPLPQYWFHFLGSVLEQMQRACSKKSRDGWMWCSGPSSLYLIFMGEGPRQAKALAAANGCQRGALRVSHSCCPAKCHDPGMQLLLRTLPAGQSNCRCVSFYLFIYVN